MASEAPPFWWGRPDWRAYALYPLSAAYGAIARRRLVAARREPVALPVLCVGNFTVGGAGKTPVAIAVAREARRMGLVPGFLSRGHGGGFSSPQLVDPHRDSARHVGDEPLLLAEHGAVAVTPNRVAGARLLAGRGCDFLIMDDGFQSARIHIDYALLVVDAWRGLGNGHVIPGGPLRAPLVDQLRFADAILKVGDGDAADLAVRMAARANKPIFGAWTRPRNGKSFAGRRFLAFAGIGNPGKFFETLRETGAEVVLTRAFPDHHPFTREDFADLSAAAAADGLDLATTEKDAVRLRHGTAADQEFLARLSILEIEVEFEAEGMAGRIIEQTLAAWRGRNGL